MFYRISELSLIPGESEEKLYSKAAKELRVSPSQIEKLKPYRKSLDARKGKVLYRYTVDVFLRHAVIAKPSSHCKMIEAEATYTIPRFSPLSERPVVVGFGPAGMFSALLLARAGLCPLVLERGKSVEERERDVSRFFQTGQLHSASNVQFGEGGAGTFSDGKLNTLLKDKNYRGRFVLEEFVRFGAPEEILYWNKPHIGTDRLRMVVRALREEILRLGGEIRFQSQLLSLLCEGGALKGVRYRDQDGEKTLSCKTLFLGIGHSARDTFRSLYADGVPMEKKIFSVGVRIEHLQERINASQYGTSYGALPLPTAAYKLSAPTSVGKQLYSFCMCPGGEVVPATDSEGCVVTNGMSYFARDGKNANAALLCNVLPEELDDDVFSGFAYQRALEEKAFAVGGGNFAAPCQLVGDFLADQVSSSFGEILPTYARGTTLCDLREVLPEKLCIALKEGIVKMGSQLRGFDAFDAVLTGVESRATSPVRILRGEDFQSRLRGLYPIGEGAGYAGGIMSSAMDGMKAVEAYFKKLEERE